jgi:hypothetical protein
MLVKEMDQDISTELRGVEKKGAEFHLLADEVARINEAQTAEAKAGSDVSLGVSKNKTDLEKTLRCLAFTTIDVFQLNVGIWQNAPMTSRTFVSTTSSRIHIKEVLNPILGCIVTEIVFCCCFQSPKVEMFPKSLLKDGTWSIPGALGCIAFPVYPPGSLDTNSGNQPSKTIEIDVGGQSFKTLLSNVNKKQPSPVQYSLF